MADEGIEVVREVDLAAPPKDVWAAIGDFGRIEAWLPIVKSCEEVHEDGKIRRHLRTTDDAAILEELVVHHEAGMSYSYTILESPLPVENYQSTLAVTPLGEGSRVSWRARFDPAQDVPEHEAARVIEGIYETGLDALTERFKAA